MMMMLLLKGGKSRVHFKFNTSHLQKKDNEGISIHLKDMSRSVIMFNMLFVLQMMWRLLIPYAFIKKPCLYPMPPSG